MVGQRVGKYLLERELGRGGMGVIWVALDQELRRRIALKILKPGHTATERLIERFRREALAIAQLHHPNVVQVYEFGIEGGTPFIAMELLAGEDLRKRLARVGRLSIGAVAELLEQAAAALGAAHAKGLVHRDLTPANLFLARSTDHEQLKILDFGVAAMLREPGELGKRNHGQLVGTPHYMSPEQACHAEFDHRADVWSLGAVAFSALMGRHPFDGSTVAGIIEQVCAAPLPRPTQLLPSLPPEVDVFFERALSRNVTERFSSTREMAAAFSEIAASVRTARARILVVDDEPDVETLVTQVFRQQIRQGAYDFVFARGGEEALEHLRQQPDIDVVLCDINMPGMDGLTLLARIADVSPVAKTVIVSAYGDLANIRTAMNRGAFDFLVKPIEVKDLRTTVEKTVMQVRGVRNTLTAIDENSAFRLLVGTAIADRILPLVRARTAGGERAEGTVVSVHIHGFRSVVEREPAGVAIHLLNDYLEIVVPELTARDGTAVRFEGETVLAFFRGPEHAERAVDACLAIRAVLRPHDTHVATGATYRLAVAAGIASGPVTFGGLGSPRLGRVEWTLVGDVVSRANHLRAVAEADQVLLTDELRRTLEGTFDCTGSGSTRFLASTEAVDLFDVLGKPGRAGAQAAFFTEHSTERPFAGSAPTRNTR